MNIFIINYILDSDFIWRNWWIKRKVDFYRLNTNRLKFYLKKCEFDRKSSWSFRNVNKIRSKIILKLNKSL